jgi:hypothetical protein
MTILPGTSVGAGVGRPDIFAAGGSGEGGYMPSVFPAKSTGMITAATIITPRNSLVRLNFFSFLFKYNKINNIE